MIEATWVLWDGDCDFCRCMAEQLQFLDRQGVLMIVPYQEAPAPPMTPGLQILAARQVQLIAPTGRRYSGAAAVLFALESVGWHAGIARLFRMRPLCWGAEVIYWLVARNRKRLGRFCW